MTNALAIVDAQATSELRIGVIFRDSFQVFRKGFWCFFVLTLISLLPEKFAEFLGADSDGTIILGFLRLFLLFVMQGASAYSVFQVRRGRQLSFAEAISRFLRRIAPVAGSALLATLIISVGFALLLIPGLIALVMFYVAVPACVVEELGPVTSLKRSVALSKGFRWKVFGLFLLWIPGAFFVSIGLNFIWGLVQGFDLGLCAGSKYQRRTCRGAHEICRDTRTFCDPGHDSSIWRRSCVQRLLYIAGRKGKHRHRTNRPRLRLNTLARVLTLTWIGHAKTQSYSCGVRPVEEVVARELD